MSAKNTDLIIIGAGPGGYRAAELAAKSGLQVVIIEKQQVGGTCLNEGCIPTKCYARNAEVLSLLRESDTFGIHHEGLAFQLSAARQRKDEVIAQLRSGIDTLLSQPGITMVHGEARFVSASPAAFTVSCDSATASGTLYTAPRVIVATGSVPKALPIEGAALALDSSDLLQLEQLPQRLCIVGAGVIGMEFASIFSAFGTKVTVVEFLKECLPALDGDIAKRLRKVMEKRGVTFHLQSAVKAISQTADVKLVTFADKKGNEQTVEADEVLMAVGRAPRVFDHFKNAGFDYDARTGIHVDDHFQTTVPGIYAIGDVNGRQMLAHAAEAQAKAVVEEIIAQKAQTAQTSPKAPPSAPEGATIDSPLHSKTIEAPSGAVGGASGALGAIGAAIFTSPEAACVGKSEDQLKAEGIAYECRKAFHRANGKALAMNETEGMVKLLSEPGAGRILGCHAFGAHSADLVQEASVLMDCAATVSQLRHMVHIHPTLSELLLSAAES